MAEKSTVHTLAAPKNRRFPVPRGWVIVAYALASWCVLAVIARQLWVLVFG